MNVKRSALLVLAIIHLAVASFAGQPPANICPRDPGTGRITYQAVVMVEGVPAPELYSRAKLWVSKTYRSGKAVIDLDDKDAGRIVAKGIFVVPYAGIDTMDIRHEMTVEVKEGRFRYTLTDMANLITKGQYAGTEGPLEDQAKNPFFGRKTWERVHANCLEIIDSLVKAMNQPASADSW